MRYIALTEAKAGMQLATSLYDSNGRTLVGSHILLTDNYIEKLIEYGYAGIYIEDELTQDIEVEDAISPQLRAEGMDCIEKRDIDGCKVVAEKLVEEILSKGRISLDMLDLRSYDDYTYAHSVNVGVLCGVIGMEMHMNEKEMAQLVTAARLHDLGKLAIPGEILNKPGRLTQKEYKRMQEHPVISYELIKDRFDLSAQIKVAVLFHHENVDGTGYPNGVMGEEQTLFTKILHAADVYDALVSKRPYKEPYAPCEAAEYLMGGCGILFDREVVEVMLRSIPLYPKGTEVELSDGRVGVIKENADAHNLRPIVRLLDGTTLDLSDRANMSIAILPPKGKQEVSTSSEAERKEMIKHQREAHIIAVDDMKTNLQMIYDILKDDYKVTLLKSGAQLIKYLEKNPYPDLILLDIDMPQMDGIEAAKRVMDMTKESVPIMFVSALCDTKTIMACKDLNVAGYVVRPYKPVYIRSEIERIINRWEAN